MRLDHISYVTSHEQLSDTVQRLGSRLGSTFVDGGVHPRFGTRNFTMPLLNGQYLEVVCPLDHPATETSPFGKAVSRRAAEGGGWLTWVVSTDDISPLEKRLGREAINGHRTRPDGSDLQWKQLGVLNTIEDAQLPFFIQWLTNDHPSSDVKAKSSITRIEIAGSETVISEWLGMSISSCLNTTNVSWIDPKSNNNETGIIAVHLNTPFGEIRLD